MIKSKLKVAEERTYTIEVVNELIDRETKNVFEIYFYSNPRPAFQNIESFFHWTDVLEWSLPKNDRE